MNEVKFTIDSLIELVKEELLKNIMLTYTGLFDEDAIVTAAREYIAAYAGITKKDECFVPFQNVDGSKKGLVHFALLAGQWVYVRCSKA